ncbi:hypothetical protein HDU97_009337 [Phlyctochytrium planicorne]|nr:hypothetical protein HDU97_009337 [Phlyctochytrium planicorne]
MASFPGYVYYPYNGGKVLGAFYPPDCDGPAASGGCQINSTATNPNPKKALDFCADYGSGCKVVICWILELNPDTNCYLFADPVELVNGARNQYAYVKVGSKVFVNGIGETASVPVSTPLSTSVKSTASTQVNPWPTSRSEPTNATPSLGPSQPSSAASDLPSESSLILTTFSETVTASRKGTLSTSTAQLPSPSSSSSPEPNGSSSTSIVTSPYFLGGFAAFMVTSSILVLATAWRVRQRQLNRSKNKKASTLTPDDTEITRAEANPESSSENAQGSNVNEFPSSFQLPSYDETVVNVTIVEGGDERTAGNQGSSSSSSSALPSSQRARDYGTRGVRKSLFDIPVMTDPPKSGPLFSDDLK